MKNNQFTGVLMLLLLVSTLASVYLIFKWNSFVHRQADAQVKLMQINETSAVMQRLFAETAEYAKTSGNKDINAIVQQFSTPAPAAAARPGAPAKSR